MVVADLGVGVSLFIILLVVTIKIFFLNEKIIFNVCFYIRRVALRLDT